MATGNTIATLLVKVAVDTKGFHSKMNTVMKKLRSLEKTTKSATAGMSSSMKSISLNARREMGSVNTSLEKVGKTSKSASGRYKTAMGDFHKATQKFGTKALMVFGAVSGAISGAVALASREAAKFNLEMTRSASITGATPTDMRKLGGSATNLAISTGYDANKIAEGMTTMARMGFDTEKIIAAMPHILNSATVSGEKFSTVLHTIETALSAFHMKGDETERVADVLTMASSKTRATIGGMKQVFKYAAPAAHDLGISLEELAAAGALMIHAGKEGGIAGRSLRAAMQRLSAPTERAEVVMKKLGIVIADDLGNMRPFSEILVDINKAMQGLGNTQKIGYLKDIFGMEASSGMLTLINAAGEEYKTLVGQLDDSTGATKKQAAVINNTLAKAFDRLGQVGKAAYREIGEKFAPAAHKAVNALAGLIKWFRKLPEPMKNLLVDLAVATAGFSGLMVAVLGLNKAFKYLGQSLVVVRSFWKGLVILIPALTRIDKLLGLLSVTIRVGLVTAFRAMLGPVGLVLGAFALFSPAISEMIKKYDEAKKKFQEEIKPKPIKIKIKTPKSPGKQGGILPSGALFDNLPSIDTRTKEVKELDKAMKDLVKTNEEGWPKVREQWSATLKSWTDVYNDLVKGLNDYINKNKEAKAAVKGSTESQKMDMRSFKAVAVDAWNSATKALQSFLTWLGKALQRNINPPTVNIPLPRGPLFNNIKPSSNETTNNTFNITTPNVDGRSIQRFMSRGFALRGIR